MEERQSHELNSFEVGFAVVGRDEEPIGEVMRVSLDRVCMLVGGRKRLFGRGKEHAIHSRVITRIDADTQTITVAVTRGKSSRPPHIPTSIHAAARSSPTTTREPRPVG